MATDDVLWDRYCHRLLHYGIVGDRLAVMCAADAAVRETEWGKECPPEDRVLVAAWTWPIRLAVPGRPTPNDPFALIPPRGVSPQWRAMMSTTVGAKLFFRIGVAAAAAGVTFDDLAEFVAWESGTSRSHLELLMTAQVPADVETLLGISAALQVRFRGGNWYVETPDRLESRIQRGLVAARVRRAADNLALDTLLDLEGRAAGAQVTDPEAPVDPEAFATALKKRPAQSGEPPRSTSIFRPLYNYLMSKPDSALPPMTFAEVNEAADGMLPIEARKSSWWSGGDRRSRSHIRAWQAAGYVAKVQTERDRATGRILVSTVQFHAMPGREAWYRNREAIEDGSYEAALVGDTLSMKDLVSTIGARSPQFESEFRTRAGDVAKTWKSDWIATAQNFGPDDLIGMLSRSQESPISGS